MEQTMKRLKQNYKIQWLPIGIIISILLFIYVGIGVSTVSEIRDVLDTGYLDNMELNENQMYQLGEQEYATYPKYRYAVAFGESNQFNYAYDGFSYTDTLGLGRKTFVFDYSWYGGTEFDSVKIVDYINNNYWLMVFRMVVYSNQLVVALMLFIGMNILNYWLMPIITHALSSLFGLGMAIRGTIIREDNLSLVRVYEARVLRQTVESYENAQFMVWVTGYNALLVSLYAIRFQEDKAVFVALWVNLIVVIFYLLNKIVVNHIRIVKEHKNKGEEDK